jgi:Cu/Zn superoxide dismutase
MSPRPPSMTRFLAAMSAPFVSVILLTTNTSAQGIQKATASIFAWTGDPSITGLGTLTERPSDEGVKLVDVSVTVQRLAPGKYAVHIHEVGDCTPCGDAGGHFDPGRRATPTPK